MLSAKPVKHPSRNFAPIPHSSSTFIREAESHHFYYAYGNTIPEDLLLTCSLPQSGGQLDSLLLGKETS
jgi:hypothetical protein